jgi:integrase
MAQRLTDKLAVNLPLPERGQTIVSDSDVPGFGVRLTPTKRTFVFSYRGDVGASGERMQRRITIGKVGPWKVAAARLEASGFRRRVDLGEDPLAADERAAEAKRRREELEKTVEELWERYLIEVVDAENKPSWAAEKRRVWKARIKPKIGALKVADVTTQDCSDLVRSCFSLDKDGRVTGGKAAGGNVYRLLHHLFSKALLWKLRSKELGNPLEDVVQPKVEPRQRLLTGAEVGVLLRAVDAAEAIERQSLDAKAAKTGRARVVPSATQAALAVIRVVLFTGARAREISQLEWASVREADLELHFGDTKTGFSAREISREALAAIKRMPRRPGIAHVFASDRKPDQPIDYTVVRDVFRDVCTAAGVANCTLHTIRHRVVTTIANNVSNPKVGMKLSGHKSLQAYMAYVHAEREQTRNLADKLGALTASWADEEAVVVPLRTVAD